MNLISCNNCGVVLDANKLKFPEDIFDEEGCVIPAYAVWDGEEFQPKVRCPICKEDIIKE